jgi:tRNA-2-methylthio-N6-dimethylallyladenosine synthase
MSKKYLIHTFGCQMNVLDSEKIAGNLQFHGMEAAEDVSEADVIILNTCSVREKAVQKVYARLGEIKRCKKLRPHLRVGVVGCMAQLEKDRILSKMKFVDVVAGPQKGHIMGELFERSERSASPVVEMRLDEDPAPLDTLYVARQNPWRASVTISEGCNRNCSFCIVPLVRGKERVRESANILREVEALVGRGTIEVVLLGQTVNSYVDRSGERVSFAQLLKRMASIAGLERIRFTSPHPGDFSDELLEVMASCPQICNHIHLPVQSGSSRVLRAMRRGYSRERYLDVIHTIQGCSRPIAISTDIIVGFPGETEADFGDTLSLLDDVQYDSAFSFKYSPRPNTAALKLPGEIPEEEKGRRLEILQEHQRRIQTKRNAAYKGKIVEVLVDDRARSLYALSGRTSDNKIVNFDGPENLMGRIVCVEISGSTPNSLKGIWIPSEAAGHRPSSNPQFHRKEAEPASVAPILKTGPEES